jgi:hypothetical protein
MKMSEAITMMRQSSGYRVHFERREDGLLCSDFFPDRDEPPIADLHDAWELARKWSLVDPERYVNIYVISAYDWVPVEGYQRQKHNRYPEPMSVDV